MEKQHHKKDADIIKEGDEGTQMFVLEKGAVQVTKVKFFSIAYTSWTIDWNRNIINTAFRDMAKTKRLFATYHQVCCLASLPSCTTADVPLQSSAKLIARCGPWSDRSSRQ